MLYLLLGWLLTLYWNLTVGVLGVLCFILVAYQCSSPVLILINSLDHSHIIHNHQTIAPPYAVYKGRTLSRRTLVQKFMMKLLQAIGEAFCQS